MSERINKINSLIKEQISEIMSRELDIKPGVFLTISKIDTTKDLRYARIFVSVFPEKEANYAMQTLKKEHYILQGALNKKLPIKILPKIEFVLDTTEARADDIEKIFKSSDY